PANAVALLLDASEVRALALVLHRGHRRRGHGEAREARRERLAQCTQVLAEGALDGDAVRTEALEAHGHDDQVRARRAALGRANRGRGRNADEGRHLADPRRDAARRSPTKTSVRADS